MGTSKHPDHNPEPVMVIELRKVIRRDGRSLNELEKQSGLKGGQLSRFVRGERDISFAAAAKLFDTLGITFNMPAGPAAEPEPAAAPAKGKPARKPKRT